jgi:hypothetical protein
MITAQSCMRGRQLAVKYLNIDLGNPDDVRFKSNVLIGQYIFMNQSQLL